ncbi:MAG: trigger factor [Mycoplasmoidaceae bacterium]
MKNIKLNIKETEIEVIYTFNNAEWKKIIGQEEKKILKTIKVPGFRVGTKAAQDQAKKMVNNNDILNHSIDPALKHAIKIIVTSEEFKKNEATLINNSPTVDILKLSNEELEIAYKFKKIPSIKVPDLKDFVLKAKIKKISNTDIESEIERFQKEKSILISKSDGSIEKGDFVTFDFKGFLDDEPFENGEAKNYELEIGSNQFIPGFEDQMIGMKVNDEKKLHVNFPENYQEKKLAGKPVAFDIKIHDIKTKQMPELNDDFVKDLELEKINTLEDLKTKIKLDLKERNKLDFMKNVEEEFVNFISESSKLSYDEEFLYQNECQQILEKNKQQLQQYGIDFEQFKKMTGMTDEKFHQQAAAEARKLYIYKLAMDEIILQDKEKLSEEELNDEIENIAKQSKKTVKEILEIIGSNIDLFKKDILRIRKAKKIIDKLIK